MTLLPILLPSGFNSKVAVKDKITAGQIIAEKKEELTDEIIYLAKDLKIPPKKITKALKKNLGDRINRGEIVAAKKGSLGMGGKKIISEFSGTINKIDEEKGEIWVRVLAKSDNPENILSPVDAVVDLCDNEKIVLKTEKPAILLENTCGKNVRGELLCLSKEFIDDEDVKKEVSGKIIVGKKFEKAAVFKAIAMGTLGIITTDIDNARFSEFTERKIDTPIFSINNENYSGLLKYKEHQVYMDSNNKVIIVL